MSEIEKAIETLKAENELILFDPNTGELGTYEQLNEFNQDCYTGHIVAISALEKQVPKEPYYYGDGYSDGELVYDMSECPVCKHAFEYGINDWGSAYCPDCGQRLSWEVE